MSPVLGVIADDHTGGSDVAAALRRAGMRTVLRFGIPAPGTVPPDCDAVVVALKTRSLPAAEAVDQSSRAWDWLAEVGVRRLYVKYCSTFDSTDEGNIGPVTDALADGALTLICPASPEHGRTTYLGHLFVDGALLSESPMRHHPLTPMTDSNLVRVLARQTPHPVGLLPLDVVRAGAIRAHLDSLAARGIRHVVVDATEDGDLIQVARATDHLPVVTGGAGLAGAIARTTSIPRPAEATTLPSGPAVILAGSCSAATLGQLGHALARFPAHRLDPVATPDPADLAGTALAWLDENFGDVPVVLYSSANVEERDAARAAMGPDTSGVLERTLGLLAERAVKLGARRVVVAGGETSGAVTAALGVDQVLVGGEADRGVPWCLTSGDDPVALLLKSGNFGRPDLLVRAAQGDLR
ncbi:3-oxo-tetronate kinase [Lentzea sp. CC55]|uniref:3-oxo-tetronate kinase n=1 Tax=Lentzea sp. CC55 TaxID=2884909 RepID=UPI001F262E9E|nr:3-oxo-tetronate kinase [Lentzea sp. CC55]MCG8927610.1 four-carbon acid sugar kinase family protein [Lentzea sp. CC55]